MEVVAAVAAVVADGSLALLEDTSDNHTPSVEDNHTALASSSWAVDTFRSLHNTFDTHMLVAVVE